MMKFKDDLLTLQVINSYPGNVNLVQKAIHFFGNNIDEFDDKIVDEYKPYDKDLACWKMLVKWVFNPCDDICYFCDRPLIVMRFIKWHLAQFAFKDLIREMIIEVLEDSYRITPIINNNTTVEKNIKYIISEIKKLDLNEPYKFEMVVGLTTLEYLNDGKNYYDDAKKIILIWMSIEGCVLSENEVHEKYINENFSPALIETVKNSKIAPLINPTFNSQKIDSVKNNLDIKPIWWKKSDRLLGYLLDELARTGLIDKNTDINRAIKEHFINQDKNRFKDSIKQNRSGASNINTSGKPKGAKDIDDIIDNAPKE